jgi:hypothetical protein
MTRVQTWTADAKARQERAANGDEDEKVEMTSAVTSQDLSGDL